MKCVVGLLSDVVKTDSDRLTLYVFLGLSYHRTFGFVFLLSNCGFVGLERDLPYKVELYPCNKGWLGATPSPQGPTPGVVGKAPQGLQGAFCA